MHNKAEMRALALCLAAAVLCGCSPALPKQAPVPSDAVAQVEVVSVERLAEVLAGMRGRQVVLNFWATWCPPCVNEMPELARFYSEMSGRVEFVSVSVDHPDLVEKRVVPFLRERQIPFRVYVLREQSPSALTALNLDWQAGAVPATFVLDKTGKARQRWEEEVTARELADAVKGM